MQEEHDKLENLLMPQDGNSDLDQDLSLTENAIKKAEAQTVIRDVLSVTLGNIFAFFSFLFPPLIAGTLELAARARGLNPNPDKKSS